MHVQELSFSIADGDVNPWEEFCSLLRSSLGHCMLSKFVIGVHICTAAIGDYVRRWIDFTLHASFNFSCTFTGNSGHAYKASSGSRSAFLSFVGRNFFGRGHHQNALLFVRARLATILGFLGCHHFKKAFVNFYSAFQWVLSIALSHYRPNLVHHLPNRLVALMSELTLDLQS